MVGLQLHGDGARSSLFQGLPEFLKVIYVLHADKNGVIQTSFPRSESGPLVDWVLVDSLQGGRYDLQFQIYGN
jgi:phosphoribosylanthranilate isomerase